MLTELSLLSLAVLALATPNPGPRDTITPTLTITDTAPLTTTDESVSSCLFGPLQCCDSLESAGSAAGRTLLSLLGIVVEGANVSLGLGCTTITIIGVSSGNPCSANTVCCQSPNVDGLVSIGCVPVIL